MNEINFFSEDVEFSLADEDNIMSWLQETIRVEKGSLDTINYIFCSDEYLLEINRTYLEHDYYTDIITFHHHEQNEPILSDIYISIDRVKDNANEEQNSFEQELNRVIIHGLLHLLGYNDKTEQDQKAMRLKEDACLSLLNK